MSIKKIICLVIAMAMLSFLFACGGETAGGNGGGGGGGETQQPGGSGGGNSGGNSGGGSGGGGNSGGGTGSGDVSGGGGETPQPGGSGGGGGDASPEPPTGGGGGGGASSNLSGTSIDILSQLVDELKNAGVEMPMTLPPSEVEAELSHNTIGLDEGDFNKLVKTAAYNLAAIGTFAHQIIVIQANDGRAAGEIKGLVSGANGYDPKKWVCVWPERVIVVESGEYVLLVAAREPVVAASIEIFKDMAGTTGTVVTFFEHEGEIEGEGGGGFGGGPIGIG